MYFLPNELHAKFGLSLSVKAYGKTETCELGIVAEDRADELPESIHNFLLRIFVINVCKFCYL